MPSTRSTGITSSMLRLHLVSPASFLTRIVCCEHFWRRSSQTDSPRCKMKSSLRIIVTGLIAQYPLGGVAWDYFQYVLGLARLGHNV